MKNRAGLAGAVAVAVLVLLAVPAFAQRGEADFTRFVALGDSYGAGVSNIGLNHKHQRWSWPAVIARQVGMNTDCVTDGPGCFQIPYISEPGILPELELVSLSPLTLALKPGLGAPMNSGLPRPYNNMSIDGAEVGDMLGVSGDGNEGLNGPIIHRNLGAPVDQVLMLQPTFVAIWVGGNDAFNGVGVPARMTSVESFSASYNEMLSRLVTGAPNAGIIVGNLPTDFTGLPVTSLIPTVLINPATGQPFRDPEGNLVPLIADLGGGIIGPVPPGSFILLPASSAMATGVGIPAALKPLLPHLPNVGVPLPDEVVSTPAEQAIVRERVLAYNSAIQAAASSRSIPVVDINALFQRFRAGVTIGPVSLSLAYIAGGIMSYDGFHLTDLGYLLFANEYIRTINGSWDTEIPVAGITQLFADNGAFFPEANTNTIVFGDDVANALRSMWTRPRASKVTGHDEEDEAPAPRLDRERDVRKQ